MYSKNSSYSLAINAESSMITPVSMFCLLSLEKWSDHRADKPDEKPNRHNRALRCQPAHKEASFRLHHDCVHNRLNGIAGIIKGNVLRVLILAAVFLPQPTERIAFADFFHNLRVVCQDQAAAAFLRRPW